MIKILVTGGTIDKEYDRTTGELVFSSTYIPGMLEQGFCRTDYVIETVMLKDSLFMTDIDREKILQIVQKCPENRIIITHGTDTMTETAKTLGANIKGKTIVLLGAMIPYSFVHSDALFNIGFALASVLLLPPGVYIAMNGKIFSYDQVIKNKSIGEFVQKEDTILSV